ncbi:MAG: trehalase, partial [Bacteroidia bacterium]|nr:trehalase [Bacteroidia bacterium]
ISAYGGFSGPFLMTQENGIWCSKVLSQLELINIETGKPLDWNDFQMTHTSHPSHLQVDYNNPTLNIKQTLVYASAHSAFIITDISNSSDEVLEFSSGWKGSTFVDGLTSTPDKNSLHLSSNKSNARGIIQAFGDLTHEIEVDTNNYRIDLQKIKLNPGENKQLLLAHSFIFDEYNIAEENLHLTNVSHDVNEFLKNRISGKKALLQTLYNKLDTIWQDDVYRNLLVKSMLTLQNNWRIPAGELKHSGLFPSYHYIWFHGFWAWDSWKHAAALAHYDPVLAAEQIKAMFDFQNEDGFIADCVYRDTTIEPHNYRNTKPPLSAWGTWKVYEHGQDLNLLKELYPKIVNQHYWWYRNRDHDNDGICEYGSTDGSLIAAKWESGMDNAVRFDSCQILQNSTTAFSLDQESVDLNAYLFAEKKYLAKMAKVLGMEKDESTFTSEANTLKDRIRQQFYDPISGWFYDTSIDGNKLITAMGCEGWIPLWAEVATPEQASAVKDNMMNSNYFNTKVPFQTLSASHPKFKPDRGYWRGPNWLDQAYFGVMGLHNYGFHDEAYDATYKLMHNAQGVLTNGISIRENYHPLTGQGMESENFSWSAAHYILLLINE